MSKNLIPIIAGKLNLEIGESFRIKNYEDYQFRFQNTTLQWLDTTASVPEWIRADDEVLIELIYGNSEIIKPPFKPKYGEEYWTYYGSHFWVGEAIWHEEVADYERKAAGIAFRTEKEAIEARPGKYRELTGKKWKE